MQERRRPIGVFDSGIGGLTVAKAIGDHLPQERILYFGDTAHLPYGDKSADAIRFYALRISKFLLEQGCKMIVIACNSASSAAYHTLLDFFEGKTIFVNVVDPLVDYVASRSFADVGVIATKATIHSHVYRDKIRSRHQGVRVHSKATPLLAPMIEEGFYEGSISTSIIRSYLEDPVLADIDALLLACTHYPLIRDEIRAIVGPDVDVLDSTAVVTRAVYDALQERDLLADTRSGDNAYYVSDYTQSFEDTARTFYQKDIQLEVVNIWS